MEELTRCLVLVNAHLEMMNDDDVLLVLLVSHVLLDDDLKRKNKKWIRLAIKKTYAEVRVIENRDFVVDDHHHHHRQIFDGVDYANDS